MKTYRVIACETIYAEYYTEIKAKNKEEAKKIALDTCVSDYKSSDLSTSAGDFEIDEIEEVQEWKG